MLIWSAKLYEGNAQPMNKKPVAIYLDTLNTSSICEICSTLTSTFLLIYGSNTRVSACQDSNLVNGNENEILIYCWTKISLLFPLNGWYAMNQKQPLDLGLRNN